MTETVAQQHPLDFDLDLEIMNTFAQKPTGEAAYVGQIYVGQVNVGQLRQHLNTLAHRHYVPVAEVTDRLRGQFVRALSNGLIQPDAVKAAPEDIRRFFNVKD